jgi:hypothetical protein
VKALDVPSVQAPLASARHGVDGCLGHPQRIDVPLYLELKQRRVGDLGGLLERALGEAGIGAAHIHALKGQQPAQARVRLVVIADGFDELQVGLPA